MIIQPGKPYAHYTGIDFTKLRFEDNGKPDGLRISMDDRFDHHTSLVITPNEALELFDFLKGWLEEDD